MSGARAARRHQPRERRVTCPPDMPILDQYPAAVRR
jgi:hypothetical protein